MASWNNSQVYMPGYHTDALPRTRYAQQGVSGAEAWDSDLISAFSGCDEQGQLEIFYQQQQQQQRDAQQMSGPGYRWNGSEYQWCLGDVQFVGLHGLEREPVQWTYNPFVTQAHDYAQPAMQPWMQGGVETAPMIYAGSHVNDTGVTARQQAWEPMYASFAEARAAIPQVDWRCRANDTTLPQSDDERQDYVSQLLTALNSVHETIGARGAKFRKRWFDPVKGVSTYYSPAAKETLCWVILAKAEKLHRLGPSDAFLSCDRKFWTAVKRTRDWSFAERIDRIAEVLARSKSKCDGMFAGSGVQLVVGNPGKMLRATKADLKQNERKRVMLEASRRDQRPVKRAKTTRRD